MVAVRDATATVLEEHGALGIGASPLSLCAVLAAVGARVATEATGNAYRVQSGRWVHVYDVVDGKVQWWERSGSLQDFHAWVVCSQPGRRLVVFDPQAAWWDEPTVLWDWGEEVFRVGIAWRAHSATTAKVVALAEEHADVCEAIYREAVALLRGRGGGLLGGDLALALGADAGLSADPRGAPGALLDAGATGRGEQHQEGERA